MNISNTNQSHNSLYLQKILCGIVIFVTINWGSLVAQTYTVISVSGSNNITLSRNDCSTATTTTGHCIQSGDTTPYVGLSYSWNGSYFVSSIISYQNLGGSSVSCGTQCENNTSGGSISGNQTLCGGNSVSTISNSSSPSGGSGTQSYRWQYSTNNSSWNTISGATGSSYNPGSISSTRYYRRQAQRPNCTSWVSSNSVTKTVTTNVTSGGTISGNQSMCGSYNPSNMSNVSSPSGGTGTLSYAWQWSPNGSTWYNVSHFTSSYQPGGPLTSTKYYRRGALRSGCSSAGYVYSNVIVKEVTSQPVGTPCNDNNSSTTNDVIQSDGCTCAGSVDPCVNSGGDSDNDGVCNNQDCSPFNASLPASPGTACNDNNSNTINDIIQSNGCTCAGTFDPCASNGGDSDNDGICNDQDCSPFNSSLPAVSGTTCNDNNANTINDIIQADGCTCAGTLDTCASNGGDSDNDGVCNDDDCSPFNSSLPVAPGTTCNDNNANSINDIIQADGCTCLGLSPGICDINIVMGETIYNDNNTPSNITDDTYTINMTINGSASNGWTSIYGNGNYGEIVIFGPFAVDEGALFIIQDQEYSLCNISVGTNYSSCVYLETCTCCSADD